MLCLLIIDKSFLGILPLDIVEVDLSLGYGVAIGRYAFDLDDRLADGAFE